MENIMLTKYSVRGIKNLEKEVTLSFYKKTFSKEVDSKGYNVKAIYGENGAGKTGLMSSVRILKNALITPGYLNNSMVQNKLGKLVNKKTRSLEFDVEFYYPTKGSKCLYEYRLVMSEVLQGVFEIEKECLIRRKLGSSANSGTVIFETNRGELNTLLAQTELELLLREKTKNLLQTSTLPSIYLRVTYDAKKDGRSEESSQVDILVLALFGFSINVYISEEDDHTSFFINDIISNIKESPSVEMYNLLKQLILNEHSIGYTDAPSLSPETMRVPREDFDKFVKQVNELKGFIKVFKNELIGIDIRKREDGSSFRCDLIMVYEDYSIDAEFESTGIKKLIRLFSYIQAAARGEIVFIDEFDSNIHDVYLCALLEYLMEYGKGQLCFTTHNIGPMDVLRNNKKSIDFLSADQQIYSWTKNGNYSPSKLYKEGMIAGSPFNVDSIDFIGVFEGSLEEA